MTTYAVYRKTSGEHYYNPTQQSYNPQTTNPDHVGGDCVYVGDLASAQSTTAAANAKIAQTTLADLLT